MNYSTWGISVCLLAFFIGVVGQLRSHIFFRFKTRSNVKVRLFNKLFHFRTRVRDWTPTSFSDYIFPYLLNVYWRYFSSLCVSLLMFQTFLKVPDRQWTPLWWNGKLLQQNAIIKKGAWNANHDIKLQSLMLCGTCETFHRVKTGKTLPIFPSRVVPIGRFPFLAIYL